MKSKQVYGGIYPIKAKIFIYVLFLVTHFLLHSKIVQNCNVLKKNQQKFHVVTYTLLPVDYVTEGSTQEFGFMTEGGDRSLEAQGLRTLALKK